MSSWSMVWAVVLIGLVGAGAASAASTGGLRCGTKLVLLGDTQNDVQATCGPPDSRQQKTEARTVRRQVRVPCADRRGWCSSTVEDSVEVPIEEWI